MAETAQTEEETIKEEAKETETGQEDSQTQAQSVDFPEASEGQVTGPGTNIDILLDMDVPITIAIGMKDISIQRLLQLCPGSVLRLDKPIGEPADLYLKGTRFATGNIVVVEDRFAVRIKEILTTGTAVDANKE